MDTGFVLLGIEAVIIALLFLVLVFSVGVVWRVEKRLDLSYKFFVGAVASLIAGHIVGISFARETFAVLLASKVLFLLGAIFFLASVLLMRKIVRELDKEV